MDEVCRLLPEQTPPNSTLNHVLVQMPLEIVALIADKLCRKDQADFRLTCKCWRDAYPVQQRIMLRQTEGWEDSAREIRRLCHEAVIVVQAARIAELPLLLPNPDCDHVSIDTRPGWAAQWALAPMHYVPDKIKEVLNPLHLVLHAIRNIDTPDRNKLEVQLRVRSTQAISDAVRAAISELASHIFQLRVIESLSYFSKQTFPIAGVKVLAFSLPYQWAKIPLYQAAVSSLPHLRELQLYLWTVNATKHANLFLRVLRQLPKVTTLRVGARWYPITLLACDLIHITNLELSWKVTLEQKPRMLKYLCLQDIRQDVGPTAVHYFEGQGPFFQKLAQSDSPVEISVHDGSSTLLLELPCNVRCLTFAHSVAKVDFNGKRFDDPQPVFERFSMLKMLQLGDFLTSELVTMFEGVRMPQLDTFGFSINVFMAFKKTYCKVVHGENVWTVGENVGDLATAFPALRHFKVVFLELEKDIHVVDARFMSKALFPKLQGVTCCSALADIVLRNLSPSCYHVSKLGNK